MARTHRTETMIALKAAQTAIRVARDVGYPPLDMPTPAEPAMPLNPPSNAPFAEDLCGWKRQLALGIWLLVALVWYFRWLSAL